MGSRSATFHALNDSKCLRRRQSEHWILTFHFWPDERGGPVCSDLARLAALKQYQGEVDGEDEHMSALASSSAWLMPRA